MTRATISAKTMVTAERARAMLNYDEQSGVFTWTAARGGQYAGSVAGTTKRNRHGSYITIKIDQRRYYAHRIAWLWKTGAHPKFVIDHRDCCGTNNAWSNLREATSAQNLMNSNLRTADRKPRGVYFEARRQKFLARLGDKHIGYFLTVEEACNARRKAAIAAFGEFVR